MLLSSLITFFKCISTLFSLKSRLIVFSQQFYYINYQQFPIPNIKHGDAKGWARRTFSSLYQCIPGVMNPHAKIVQYWNKFFVISCLFAVFLDPLFFFLLSVKQVWHFPFKISLIDAILSILLMVA